MKELNVLRTCAILHDIGKPECWANRKPWSSHAYYTYKFVRSCLGEELATHAMRHHTGSSYSDEYRPQTDVEKVVCLADNLSSGADRREEPSRGPPLPSPPMKLTHILSKGKVRKGLEARDLAYISKGLSSKFGDLKGEFVRQPKATYLRIFETLNESDLRFVPADTREPINDVSLWDHLKLTAAFATCIYMDGGWKSNDLRDYDFALLCGDADRISSFVNASRRLPDLNARSERIKKATEASAGALTDLLGPECLIYAAGGSFLAVSPKGKAEEVLLEAKEAFEESTQKQVTVTVNYILRNGKEVQKNFGHVWKRAQIEMRIEKSQRGVPFPDLIEEDSEVCDVCRFRPWAHEDLLKVLRIDAAPRPERLCEVCWELRREGKGVELDKVRGKSKFVAVLRADGDDVGKSLSGVGFKELGKSNTPSRLSTLSDLIHRVCEDKLQKSVANFHGHCLFAGGDDVLAFVPGENALEASRSMASQFEEEMAKGCTMSIGVALFHHTLPVYSGLEASRYLLRRAKEGGKNRIAFAIIGGAGVTLNELEKVNPRTWDQLDEILRIARFMRKSGAASSQIRKIAGISKKEPEKAEVFVKYLMGRRVIDWREGEKFLSYLKTGLLYDAFLVYNAFWRT